MANSIHPLRPTNQSIFNLRSDHVVSIKSPPPLVSLAATETAKNLISRRITLKNVPSVEMQELVLMHLHPAHFISCQSPSLQKELKIDSKIYDAACADLCENMNLPTAGKPPLNILNDTFLANCLK
ncbi:MAG: hypothetical protein JHC93_06450, partial [Parachlamydiales bacterium]|nr:hypothetical protein [Parachlamydiales bacterium]